MYFFKQDKHKRTIEHKILFLCTKLFTCIYFMLAAEGIEPIAIRLRAQHLAASHWVEIFYCRLALRNILFSWGRVNNANK